MLYIPCEYDPDYNSIHFFDYYNYPPKTKITFSTKLTATISVYILAQIAIALLHNNFKKLEEREAGEQYDEDCYKIKYLLEINKEYYIIEGFYHYKFNYYLIKSIKKTSIIKFNLEEIDE